MLACGFRFKYFGCTLIVDLDMHVQINIRWCRHMDRFGLYQTSFQPDNKIFYGSVISLKQLQRILQDLHTYACLVDTRTRMGDLPGSPINPYCFFWMIFPSTHFLGLYHTGKQVSPSQQFQSLEMIFMTLLLYFPHQK